MIDEQMYPATLPFPYAADKQLRSLAMQDPARTAPAVSNELQDLLLEMGTAMGHEASDYQNPNVLAGTGVLAYDSPQTRGWAKLVPAYGVGLAQTPDDVLQNILSTAHLVIGV